MDKSSSGGNKLAIVLNYIDTLERSDIAMGECIMTSARGGNGGSKDDPITVLPNATSFLVTLKSGNSLVKGGLVNISYYDNNSRKTVNLNYVTNAKGKVLFMIPDSIKNAFIYANNVTNDGVTIIDANSALIYDQPTYGPPKWNPINITSKMNRGNIVDYQLELPKVNESNIYIYNNSKVKFLSYNYANVYCVGGGGGGGWGSNGSYEHSEDNNLYKYYFGGGGGGGGINIYNNFIISKGFGYSCNIGSPGIASTPTSSGTSGGTTFFGSYLSANGGSLGENTGYKKSGNGGKGGISMINGANGGTYHSNWIEDPVVDNDKYGDQYEYVGGGNPNGINLTKTFIGVNTGITDSTFGSPNNMIFHGIGGTVPCYRYSRISHGWHREYAKNNRAGYGSGGDMNSNGGQGIIAFINCR